MSVNMQFYVGVNSKGQKIYYFTLPFRQVLNSNDLKIEEMEKFYVHRRKQCYHRYGEMVSESNNVLFRADESNRIINSIFLVKAVIDSRAITENNDFIRTLKDGILTKNCCRIITDTSDYNYMTNKIHKESTKTSQMKFMGFSTKHYKELFRISAGVKLLMPLAMHFVVTNGIEDKTQFLFDCYKILFKKLSSGDLMAKLLLYANTIINTSKKQNTPMYDRLLLEGTSVASAATNTVRQIVVDILHRARPDQDVLAFIFKVIQEQARRKSRSKFQAEYYIVGSPTEQSTISRKVVAMYNEESKMFHQIHSKQIVSDRLWDRFVVRSGNQKKYEDMFLTVFAHHKASNKYPTKVHDFLFVTFFCKTFKGSKGVMNIGSRENIVRLGVIFSIMTEQLGMRILPRIILCDKRPDRNIRVKVADVREYFENNTNISRILSTKFSYTDESKILYSNITSILSSQWSDPLNKGEEFSVKMTDLENDIMLFLKAL